MLGAIQAQAEQVGGLLLQRRGAGEQIRTAWPGPAGAAPGAGRWSPSRRGACGSWAAALPPGCAGRRPCAAPSGRAWPAAARRVRTGRPARRRQTAGAPACGACARVDEHAQEDMGAHELGAVAGEGPDLEGSGLEAAVDELNAAEPLGGAHRVRGTEVAGGQTGADDGEAVEPGLRGAALPVAPEGEAVCDDLLQVAGLG